MSMKARSIKYFIGQGFGGVFSNGLMSFASISIVTASIAVFGIFILFGINLNYIGEQITSQCELQVYVTRSADSDAVRKIRTQLEDIPGVKEVTLFTSRERYLEVKKDFEDKADVIASLEKDNPFRESYRILLTDITAANEIAEAAKTIQNVEEVKNRQDIIQKIIDVTGFFRMSSLWLVIILGFVSIFIISNTIKLGMFARRKEINIMKYVGATDWFIRWPFIVEGVIIGIIGAALATGLMLWGYSAIVGSMNEFLQPMLKVMQLADVYRTVIITFISLGGGIGIVGSAMSIRKYLFV